MQYLTVSGIEGPSHPTDRIIFKKVTSMYSKIDLEAIGVISLIDDCSNETARVSSSIRKALYCIPQTNCRDYTQIGSKYDVRL